MSRMRAAVLLCLMVPAVAFAKKKKPVPKPAPVPAVAATLPVLPGDGSALPGMSPQEYAIYKLVRQVNEIPEAQLNERTDPAYALLRSISDTDGPGYTQLRHVLSRAPVRAALNPTAKAIFAGLLTDRYDSFALAGNLWLGALKSANPEYAGKARQKLVGFIQPAHIPVLISILKTPGPNIHAYEVLQEVTGQTLDPNQKGWKDWWAHTHGQVDLVGHLLQTAGTQLAANHVRPVEIQRFWYLPEKIDNASDVYAKRRESEQMIITHWNEWANNDVRRHVDDWLQAKPIFDKIVHQPDARVNRFLETLVPDPGFGDYAAILLAWRGSSASLSEIQKAYAQRPTPSLALARGSLGDKTALRDLLQRINDQRSPLAFSIMDQSARTYVNWLRVLGIVPAEQAFDLLTHQNFGFETAYTRRQKRKANKLADRWLDENEKDLTFDAHGGYFAVPSKH